MIPVRSNTDAQAKRFIGSPTIRIDGCRVYAENGKTAGWPSVEKIREGLVERRQA